MRASPFHFGFPAWPSFMPRCCVGGRTAIVNIRQLATLSGAPGPRRGRSMREIGLVADAALVFRGGLIEAAGPASELKALIDGADETVDAAGRMATPGLIDAHTHLVFGGNRAGEFEQRARGASYQEIAVSGGGILSTVRQTREASEESLIEQARRHRDLMLSCGTTTAEAKSGYGLSLDAELKMLRVIRALSEEGPMDLVPTFLGPHAVPPEFKGNPGGFVDHLIEAVLPAVAEENLARNADAFCEPAYFGVEDVRRFLSAAKSAGLGLRVHADQLSNSGGALLAAEVGASTADHLEQTGVDGIAALARAGVQPVLLPGSVYALGHTKYPDARAMIEAGLAAVLATDFNPGSSPTPSLPMVMSLACTQMRLSPAESLVACTVNAACSLGLEASRGSLEPGKRADIVLWDADDYREIPYWFGVPLVSEVWVLGRRVFCKK